MSSAFPSRMEHSTCSGQNICCNGSDSGGKHSRSSDVLRGPVDASSAATSTGFVSRTILRTIGYRPNSRCGSPLPNGSLDLTAILAESCRTCSKPQASFACALISYQIGPSAVLVETQSAAGTGRFSSIAPCRSPPKYSAVILLRATSPSVSSSASATPRSVSTARCFTSKVGSLEHEHRYKGSLAREQRSNRPAIHPNVLPSGRMVFRCYGAGCEPTTLEAVIQRSPSG
jgi:hypothetical protein